MADNWNQVRNVGCRHWLVLPAVYSDALSYGDQIAQFCSALNKVIQNNNNLPSYVQQMIQEYINGGVIGEIVQSVIAEFVLNVKFPPNGIKPAVGDGSADDTEAIQGCINYAYNNGGMAVYFPSGSYLTQPLTLRDKTTLFGADRYTTRIVMKGGATTAMFTGDVDELTLTSLGFDGNMDIQVNNVNLFTISVNSAIITNCLLTDGYDLLNITVNDDLQLNDIIFKHAVENSLVLKGEGIVQGYNLIFKSVSTLVGKNFVVMDVSKSILEQLKCYGASPNAVLINGSNNVVKMWNEQSLKAYTDNGVNNTVEVYTQSEQKNLTGFKTSKISGDLTETVGGDKHVNATNSIETIEGDKTITADNIFETTANKTVHVTSNITEQIGGTRTLTVTGANNETTGARTETVNGNKTETITGEKEVNANSLTENITENKTETVNGNYNGKFGSATFETESSSWKVKFPEKTVDLADIGKMPVRNFWLIGDSYGNTYHPETQTYTDGWCNLLAKNLLPSLHFVNNVYIDFLGGAGFSGGSSTFTDLITEWIRKYDDITDVVICAGRNDFFQSTTNINNGMLAVANIIKAKFPNIRLYVGMIGYDLNITEFTNNKFYAAIETTVNYKNGAASYGYTYLTNVEAILHNTDLMRSDGKHPNEAGGNKLAEGIFQALQGCCNVGYPLRSCGVTVTNGTVQKGEFREILNNTTISILNMEGVNITFSPNRNIICNPETYTELLGTVDFKYFNGYEYGLSRIPAIFVYSNAGVYGTASGYVAFEGHNLYVAILKLNDEKNNFDTIEIDSLQILPFSTQYTF